MKTNFTLLENVNYLHRQHFTCDGCEYLFNLYVSETSLLNKSLELANWQLLCVQQCAHTHTGRVHALTFFVLSVASHTASMASKRERSLGLCVFFFGKWVVRRLDLRLFIGSHYLCKWNSDWFSHSSDSILRINIDSCRVQTRPDC